MLSRRYCFFLVIFGFWRALHGQEINVIESKLDGNPLFALRIESVSEIEEWTRTNSLISQDCLVFLSQLKMAFSQGNVVSKDRDEVEHDKVKAGEGANQLELLEAFRCIAGQKGVSILGYVIGDRVEFALICSPDAPDCQTIMEKMRSIQGYFGTLNSTPAEGSISTENDPNDFTTFEYQNTMVTELSGFGMFEETYCFVRDEHFVICTSRTLIENIIGSWTTSPKYSLALNRRYLAIKSLVRYESASIWAYITPNTPGGAFSIDDYISIDQLLPYFMEKTTGVQSASEMIGLGVRVDLRKTEDDSTPLLVVEVIAKTALPRDGLFSVLEKASPVEFPQFILAKSKSSRIEKLSAVNAPFGEIYDQIGSDYEKQNGAGSWEDRCIEIKELYHNKFDFEELYDRASGSHFGIRLRNLDDMSIDTLTCFEMKDEDSADWFTGTLATSGYLNQQFPFEESHVTGYRLFARSPNMLQKYGKSINSSKPYRSAFLSAGKWSVQGNEDFLRDIPNPEVGVDLDKEADVLPIELSDRISKLRTASELRTEPYFVDFTSDQAGAGALVRLKRAVEFEVIHRGESGVSHPDAPKNVNERVVMMGKFYLLQALLKAMGDRLVLRAIDENSVRIVVGYFRAPTQIEFGGSLTELQEFSNSK